MEARGYKREKILLLKSLQINGISLFCLFDATYKNLRKLVSSHSWKIPRAEEEEQKYLMILIRLFDKFSIIYEYPMYITVFGLIEVYLLSLGAVLILQKVSFVKHIIP